MKFNSFVGIDWSGAEQFYRKKLAVAVCGKGDEDPVLLKLNRGWTRTEVFEQILKKFTKATLIGIDFAFSYPYLDRKAYFPGHARSLESPQELWRLVEEAARGEVDFYGGRLIKENYLGLTDYYRTWEGTNSRFVKRFRVTEEVCRKSGVLPKSVFQVVGVGQVGMGTLAGMRLLHALKNRHVNQIAIWPFDEFQDGQTVIVEIYPARFTKTESFQPFTTRIRDSVFSRDEKDALISAAALRRLSSREESWRSITTNEAGRYEGWIFGVS